MKSEDQSRTISQGEISENAPKRKRKRPKHPFWDFQPFAIPGCCHGPGSPVPGVYGFHKGFSVHRLTTVVHCPLNGWSFCYICAWHVSKSIFWTRKYYIICLRLSRKDLEMFRMLEHWVPRFVSTCSSRQKVLRALLEIETRNGLWALVTKYMGWPFANNTPNKITMEDTGDSLFKTC